MQFQKKQLQFACFLSIFLGSIRKGSWKVSKMLSSEVNEDEKMDFGRWSKGLNPSQPLFAWNLLNLMLTNSAE